MFADIEIAHTIDHNYDINDKFARPHQKQKFISSLISNE